MALSEAVATEEQRAVVRELVALGQLPEELRTVVIESFVPEQYAFGEAIVRQDEPGDALYVIASGRARIVRRDGGIEVALGTLAVGDSFGETSILSGEPRTASVRASTDVVALRLDSSIFRALVRVHPSIREAFEIQARVRAIEHHLRLDSAFSALPSSALPDLARRLESIELQPGELAVAEGDPADSLLLVQDGRLVAFTEGGDYQRVNLRYLRTGDFLGELAIVRRTPRTVSVEAIAPTRLLSLPAAAFLALLAEHEEVRERVEERIAVYERGPSAEVPLDFAEQLETPAQARRAAAAGQVADTGPRVDESVLEELDAAAPQLWRRRRFWPGRFPFIRQIDEMDCGAASVAIVCRAFGRPVSLSKIRDVCGTAIDGTSLHGIKRGGEAIGLRIQTIKASKDRLDDLPLPAIVHWDANHWIVLYEVGHDHVRVADPARGLRRYTRDELLEKWSGFAGLCSATPELAEAPVSSLGIGWLWQFVRPYWRTLAVTAVLAILAAGLEMLLPVMSQKIVDDVLPKDNGTLLHLLGLGMLGLLGLGLVAALIQARLISTVSVKIDAGSLDFVSDRLLRLPTSYFATRRTGDIERRLDGLRQVRLLVVRQGSYALIAVTQFIAAIGVMLAYSWPLALGFLATMPIYIGMMAWSTTRLRPVLDDLEEGFGKYRSRQLDAIKGIETVKSLGAEEGLRASIMRDFSELSERIVRADRTLLGYEAVSGTATLVLVVFFLWLGALQVLAGNLTLGELVSFNALILLATSPLQIMLALWDQAQLSAVLVGRLRDILEQEPEQSGEDPAQLRAVPTLEGRLTLRGVGFAFPTSPDTPILQDISLDIEPGTTIALVGRSGSGKSTLVRCLAGLMPATAGAIAYDGVDLGGLRHRDLRRRIGVVLQQPHVFDDTITANIAFGELDPDMQRVQWAAEVADATSSSLGSRSATGRRSGRAAWRSPAASSSGSRSRARCTTSRRSSCSTRRPAPWTPNPSGPSSRTWTRCWRTGRRSSSPTGSRPCATRI